MPRKLAETIFHATAVLYTGGCIAQISHLVFKFSWQYMPFFVDWVIIVVGSSGAIALTLCTSQIAYRGTWERIVHVLIIIHLLVSVVMHIWALVAGHHNMFGVFPYEYSYLAAAYFGLFAWRQWTIRFNARGVR